MPQKIFKVDGVGDVLVVKRKKSRHLRLSVTPANKARVSIPTWMPYSAGITFVKSKKSWLERHMSEHGPELLADGDAIGKFHRLRFELSMHGKSRTRISGNEIFIYSTLPFVEPEVQALAVKAAERALKLQAERLLPHRLAELAKKHGFEYSSIKIKKLTSRWGSCNHKKEVSLSFYLMQLPWDLIDYVIVHELAHTVHLDHSQDFWRLMEQKIVNYKLLRKEAKKHKPYLKSIKTV